MDTKRYVRSGSVLLLVVGLLTIIAMLGGTFLVVARLSSASASASQEMLEADQLALGAFQQLLTDVVDNLAIGTAPYSSTSGKAGWDRYAPHPSVWRKLHNPDATLNMYSDVVGTSSTYIDVDGDGAVDAYAVPFATINGQQLWAAFKVEDTSGKVCVNTAGEYTASGTMVTIPPVCVDMPTIVGGSYATVHAARSGGAAAALTAYYTGAARVLLSAAAPYKPFSVGDEMGLRVVGSDSPDFGWLLTTVPFAAATRKHLTTYSVSRTLPRIPRAAEGFSRRMPLTAATLNNTTLRNRLRAELNESAPTEGAGPPAAAADGGAWEVRFDCGNGPVAPGYVSLPATGAAGATWSGGQYDRDRLKTDPLTRDFAAIADTTLSITVPSPGKYEVSVTLGDASYPQQGQNAAVGSVVLANNVTTNTGQHLTYTAEVDVATTVLSIRFWCTTAAKTVVDAVVVKTVGGTVPPAAASDQAGHFTANLWAALDTPFDPAKAYQITGATGNLYGVIAQPVIAEVYAKNEPSKNTGTGAIDPTALNFKWACAIELLNPTTRPLNLSTYKLTGLEATTPEFPLGARVLNAGQRLVLYKYDYGINAVKNLPADFGFPADPTTQGWVEVPGLSLLTQDKIRLVRTAETHVIPMDSIERTEIDYQAGADPAIAPEQVKCGQRDDDSIRKRVAVAAYEKGTDHTLGLPNTVTAAQLPEIKQGYDLDIKHGEPITTIGALGRIFVEGPSGGADGRDLPHALYAVRNEPFRGYADFAGKVKQGADKYPDVPMAACLGELFECLTPDNTRQDDPQDPVTGIASRVYGRININTATSEILQALPWPRSVTGPNGAPIAIDPATLAQWIVSYREVAPLAAGGEALNRMHLMAPDGTKPYDGMTNLRQLSKQKGFLTPGELAIPLAKYMDTRIAEADRLLSGYPKARDALYDAVSNCITVNGDSYSVVMKFMLGADPNNPVFSQKYVAMIDRSNCSLPGHRPAVLLLTKY